MTRRLVSFALAYLGAVVLLGAAFAFVAGVDSVLWGIP